MQGHGVHSKFLLKIAPAFMPGKHSKKRFLALAKQSIRFDCGLSLIADYYLPPT